MLFRSFLKMCTRSKFLLPSAVMPFLVQWNHYTPPHLACGSSSEHLLSVQPSSGSSSALWFWSCYTEIQECCLLFFPPCFLWFIPVSGIILQWDRIEYRIVLDLVSAVHPTVSIVVIHPWWSPAKQVALFAKDSPSASALCQCSHHAGSELLSSLCRCTGCAWKGMLLLCEKQVCRKRSIFNLLKLR